MGLSDVRPLTQGRRLPLPQARLDSLGSEVEQRRDQLIAIAEQQVLQASAAPLMLCFAWWRLGAGTGKQ